MTKFLSRLIILSLIVLSSPILIALCVCLGLIYGFDVKFNGKTYKI